MKYLILAAFLPCAAMADGLSTDFDKIYADNADLVEQTDGGQSLELPSKIILGRNAEGDYLGLDGSPHGAMGCILQLTVQSAVVTQLCPQSASEEQKTRLMSNIDRIADFYAANNVPMRPVEEVRAGIDSAMASLSDRLSSLECKKDELSAFEEFLAGLVNDQSQERLAASLATPRLPVTQPCL